MGLDKELEEKFKKDVSKEISNLKEFLIQQGKEILKIKQENKSLREGSVTNRGEGGPTVALSPEIRAILDKQQLALDKQKENTTKLSKLCLGTLNELEKLEKQQQDRQTDPRTEDKIRRLTDENKKLIQLVTALDQQMSVLEGKIEKSLPRTPRQESGQGGVAREEVLRLVREAILPLHQDNNQKDGQLQSLVAEVQNIIGQNRETALSLRETADKVRRLEADTTNEKFGLELASAISRLEKVEKEGKQLEKKVVPTASDVNPRIPAIEAELKKIKDQINSEEERGNILKADITLALSKVQKSEAELQKIAALTAEATGLKDELTDLKTELGKVEKSLESKITKCQTEQKKSAEVLQGKMESSLANLKATSATLEDLKKKIETIETRETKAANTRSSQNSQSVEDIKGEVSKLQEQVHSLANTISANAKSANQEQKDIKSAVSKAETELSLLTEKLKSLSISVKDDKLKYEVKETTTSTSLASIETTVSNLKSSISKIESTVKTSDDQCKRNSHDLDALQRDLGSVKASSDKAVKSTEDLNNKIFDCIHDYENLKETVDKLNKKVDRRPAAEELDKKSELTNKLYNDLSTKIEDLEISMKQDLKKTKLESDKNAVGLKSCNEKIEEYNTSITKESKDMRNQVNQLMSNMNEVKVNAKEDMDKKNMELKLMLSKVEETKKDLSAIQKELPLLKMSIEKCQGFEKDVLNMKDNDRAEKISTLEKEILSLRTDHEKNSKEVKAVSTEVKFLDSNIKKDSTNHKTELSSISKSIKGLEKDITTLHNMVEVLNSEKGGKYDDEDITSIKSDMKKLKSDFQICDKKTTEIKDDLLNKIQTEIQQNDQKIQKLKEELLRKMNDLSQEVKAIEKVDKNKVQELTTEINKSSEVLILKSKEECLNKINTCLSDIKNLEKKIDGCMSNMSDPKNVNDKLKQSQEDIMKNIEFQLSKCREELNVKVTLAETKTQKIKEDLLSKSAGHTTDIKALEKKVEEVKSDTKSKLQKQEENIMKLQKSAENMEKNSKAGDQAAELKKEVERINKEIKESLLKWENKMTAQETQVTQVKTTIKDVAEKLSNLEKPGQKSQQEDNYKKEVDKINQQIKENKKSVDDAVAAHTKGLKELTEKLGKLEKSDASTKSHGSETSKLTTLTKAIDSIQENSKSLETMVKKMKTEFSTPKDLEKLKSELLSKVTSSGGGSSGNNTDIGPIMESLIMTNDRPFVDCSTVTPMTGNGLVKFDRFNAMNKLPWDDVNDQFVIQEPGVYVVFVTAILQDAVLSVKIASNMLEREVCSVGSREGLVGIAAPAFVSRTALFQIEDDDNVCETVLLEIHAENDDSFVDKNVSLTMYKIAESTAGD